MGIALAAPTALLTVRSIDLDHLHTLGVKMAGEPGAVASSAFHPDAFELTERAQPVVQAGVAGRCRVEALHAQQGAGGSEGGSDVHVEVRVDPSGDRRWHRGHGHPFVGRRGGDTTPAGTTDRTAMGREKPGS